MFADKETTVTKGINGWMDGYIDIDLNVGFAFDVYFELLMIFFHMQLREFELSSIFLWKSQ